MPSQIACQMYTLREFTKTPADIARTLARVKKIGFDAVQLSALGPIDANELATILKNEGLTCCVTHASLDRMKNDTAAVIHEHKLWGCQYTAIGGFFPSAEGLSLKTWLDFIVDYSAVAKKFAGSGLTIGYHNHSHELARFDGQIALQLLIDKLDPSIWFEIDTYWITHGGGDPTQWINKIKGRIPCVHFKDMAIKPDRTQYMAEVGEGNLNWPAIIRTCRDAGVQWYIIEQDVCYRDPFDSLAISLKNLRELGIK